MTEQLESLGTYLRNEREKKNISLEQVAYATRIGIKMLSSLETDTHEQLPAPTFVRGYLQAYGKYVRLDTQDLLLRYQHYLATNPTGQKTSIKSHYLYVKERYQEKKRVVLIVSLSLVALMSVGAFIAFKAKKDKHRLANTQQVATTDSNPVQAAPLSTPTIIPTEKLPAAAAATQNTPPIEKLKEKAKQTKDVPAVAEKLPEAVKTPEVVKTPEPTKTPEIAKKPETVKAIEAAVIGSSTENKIFNLKLAASEDVWFRFQTDADPIKDLTLRKDKIMYLHADKVIKIFSGNLMALKTSLNGKEVALAQSYKEKSAVIPEAEKANYPLPLFPGFNKPASDKKLTTENKPAAQGDAAQKPTPQSDIKKSN